MEKNLSCHLEGVNTMNEKVFVGYSASHTYLYSYMSVCVCVCSDASFIKKSSPHQSRHMRHTGLILLTLLILYW